MQPAPKTASEPAFADIAARVEAYRAGRDPVADLEAVYERIAHDGERPVWISLLPLDRAKALLAEARLKVEAGAELPLFGIPFAVKDNIDVAGLATTAACPDYAFMPERSGFAVERLIAAGAIPIGKTNLDQFATGLNGSRSPYGVPACVFDELYVSGGSSSGSAVAVAAGLVPFALGTDTAGSGRVPAGFNNIVGLKPSKGLISTRGVVPACRTLDCISVFAANADDALKVAAIASGHDEGEPYSRQGPDGLWSAQAPASFRFGTLSQEVLARCAADVVLCYQASVKALQALGGTSVAIDYAPFEAAAALLYAGPWVAERLAAIRDFAATQADAIHPVVREIVLSGADYTAVDAFEGQYKLAALIAQTRSVWDAVDILLLPTAPNHPTIAAMLADPVGENSRLGLFTNFVNLMDLAALSVPAGRSSAGLPIGVTLVGPAFSDGMLARLGDLLHRSDAQATLAATAIPLSKARAVAPVAVPEERRILLAVVGAHLSGQPLNHQLTQRDGTFVASARTAAGYSLYALGDTVPPKPGLVFDGGAGLIALELWSLSEAAFGSFVAAIPAPLGIGTLTLEDGTSVKGFLCESHALATATDITAFGGWLAFLASRTKAA